MELSLGRLFHHTLNWNAAHDLGVVRPGQFHISGVFKPNASPPTRPDSNLVHYICLIHTSRQPGLRQLWEIDMNSNRDWLPETAEPQLTSSAGLNTRALKTMSNYRSAFSDSSVDFPLCSRCGSDLTKLFFSCRTAYGGEMLVWLVSSRSWIDRSVTCD